MKTQKLAALLLTAAFITTAHAQDVAECQGYIYVVDNVLNMDVKICTDSASIKRGEHICEGMNKKLAGADKKLDEGKFTDAGAKLDSFQTTLDSLLQRKKVSEGEYNALNQPLGQAKTCVADLSL